MDPGLFTDHRMTNEPYPGAFASFRPPRGKYDYFKAAAAGAGKYIARKYYGKRKRGREGNPHSSKAKVYRKTGYTRKFRRKNITGVTRAEPQGNGRSFTHVPLKPSLVSTSLYDAVPMQHYLLNAGSESTCAVGVQQIVSFGLGGAADLLVAVHKIIDATSTADQMF